MFIKNIEKIFFLLILLQFFYQPIIALTLYTNNFSGSEPPTGWTEYNKAGNGRFFCTNGYQGYFMVCCVDVPMLSSYLNQGTNWKDYAVICKVEYWEFWSKFGFIVRQNRSNINKFYKFEYQKSTDEFRILKGTNILTYLSDGDSLNDGDSIKVEISGISPVIINVYKQTNSNGNWILKMTAQDSSSPYSSGSIGFSMIGLQSFIYGVTFLNNLRVIAINESSFPGINNTNPTSIDIIISPNPFKFDNQNNTITFFNLIPNSEIKIFSISGKLIKDLKIVNNNKYIWDVKDNHGKLLPSGVYMCYFSNPQGMKKYQQLVIKR